jgi:hypothetical protein
MRSFGALGLFCARLSRMLAMSQIPQLMQLIG